ncbi:DUF5996 family protein [Arthrobacter sp. TMN-37]
MTAWPALRVDDWSATRTTLHMWLQIVGKIRMAHAPMVNHWWQVPLYVTPRGLGTSTVPCGLATFDIEFDFVADTLRVRHSGGGEGSVALEPKSVSQFYGELTAVLEELEIPAPIRPIPNEVDPAVPFAEDHDNRSYDHDAVHLFWQQLIHADRVLQGFRSSFAGKVSPAHFFWGGMDLACTRFSGRPAPPHPGGVPNCPDWVMVEGYSHELWSSGFWAGGSPEGSFYTYAYPEPDGFRNAPAGPREASYREDLGLFLLPYDAVRRSADPDAMVLEFLQATYAAAADAAGWERSALEADPDRLLRPAPRGT